MPDSWSVYGRTWCDHGNIVECTKPECKRRVQAWGLDVSTQRPESGTSTCLPVLTGAEGHEIGQDTTQGRDDSRSSGSADLQSEQKESEPAVQARGHLDALITLFRKHPEALNQFMRTAALEIGEALGGTSPARSPRGVQESARLDIAYLFSDPIVQCTNNTIHPFQTGQLDWSHETNRIREVFEKKKRRVWMKVVVATLERLKTVLREDQPRILHINCHGALRDSKDSAGIDKLNEFNLVFESGLGVVDYVTPSKLKEILAGGDSKNKFKVPDVVIVSACNSYAAGRVFQQAGIPYVVTVQPDTKISDDTCISFSEQFYQRLFLQRDANANMSVRSAFREAVVALNDSQGHGKSLKDCCCSHNHRNFCQKYRHSMHAPTRKCGCALHGDSFHELHCRWVNEDWIPRMGKGMEHWFGGNMIVLTGSGLPIPGSEERLKSPKLQNSDPWRKASEQLYGEGKFAQWVREGVSSNINISEIHYFEKESDENIGAAFALVRVKGSQQATTAINAINNNTGLGEVVASQMRVCCCAPHVPHNHSTKLILLEQKEAKDEFPALGARITSGPHLRPRSLDHRTRPEKHTGLFIGRSKTMFEFLKQFTDPKNKSIWLIHNPGRGTGIATFAQRAAQHLYEREKIDKWVKVDVEADAGDLDGLGQDRVKKVLNVISAKFGLRPPPANAQILGNRLAGLNAVVVLTKVGSDQEKLLRALTEVVNNSERSIRFMLAVHTNDTKTTLRWAECRILETLSPENMKIIARTISKNDPREQKITFRNLVNRILDSEKRDELRGSITYLRTLRLMAQDKSVEEIMERRREALDAREMAGYLSGRSPWSLSFLCLLSFFQGGLLDRDLDVLWSRCPNWGNESSGGVEGEARPPKWRTLVQSGLGMSVLNEDDDYPLLQEELMPSRAKKYNLRLKSLRQYLQKEVCGRDKDKGFWVTAMEYINQVGADIVAVLMPSEAEEVNAIIRSSAPRPKRPVRAFSAQDGKEARPLSAQEAKEARNIHWKNMHMVFSLPDFPHRRIPYSVLSNVLVNVLLLYKVDRPDVQACNYVCEHLIGKGRDLLTRFQGVHDPPDSINALYAAGGVLLRQYAREEGLATEDGRFCVNTAKNMFHRLWKELQSSRRPRPAACARLEMNLGWCYMHLGSSDRRIDNFQVGALWYSEALDRWKSLLEPIKISASAEDRTSVSTVVHSEAKVKDDVKGDAKSYVEHDSKADTHLTLRFAYAVTLRQMASLKLKEAKRFELNKNTDDAQRARSDAVKHLNEAKRLHGLGIAGVIPGRRTEYWKCLLELAKLHLKKGQFAHATKEVKIMKELVHGSFSHAQILSRKPKNVTEQLEKEIERGHWTKLQEVQLTFLYASPLGRDGSTSMATQLAEEERATVWSLANEVHSICIRGQVATREWLKRCAQDGCVAVHLSCALSPDGDILLEGQYLGQSDRISVGILADMLRSNWNVGFKLFFISVSGFHSRSDASSSFGERRARGAADTFDARVAALFDELATCFRGEGSHQGDNGLSNLKHLVCLSVEPSALDPKHGISVRTDFIKKFYEKYLPKESTSDAFHSAWECISKDDAQEERKPALRCHLYTLGNGMRRPERSSTGSSIDSELGSLVFNRTQSAPIPYSLGESAPSALNESGTSQDLGIVSTSGNGGDISPNFDKHLADAHLSRDLSTNLAMMSGVPPLPLVSSENSYNAPDSLFWGRYEELSDIVPLLWKHRLLGLYGNHGVGVSSLAAAAARYLRARDTYRDGVFWVSVSDVSSIQELLRAIGSALDFKDNDCVDTNELIRRAKNFQMLLILDDVSALCAREAQKFRHFVYELCDGTNHLAILTTSYRPALNRPNSKYEVSPLAPIDSVRLFLDRCHRRFTEAKIRQCFENNPFSGLLAGPSELDVDSASNSSVQDKKLRVARHSSPGGARIGHRNARLLEQHPLLKGLGGIPRDIIVAADLLNRDSKLSLDKFQKVLLLVRSEQRRKILNKEANRLGRVNSGDPMPAISTSSDTDLFELAHMRRYSSRGSTASASSGQSQPRSKPLHASAAGDGGELHEKVQRTTKYIHKKRAKMLELRRVNSSTRKINGSAGSVRNHQGSDGVRSPQTARPIPKMAGPISDATQRRSPALKRGSDPKFKRGWSGPPRATPLKRTITQSRDLDTLNDKYEKLGEEIETLEAQIRAEQDSKNVELLEVQLIKKNKAREKTGILLSKLKKKTPPRSRHRRKTGSAGRFKRTTVRRTARTASRRVDDEHARFFDWVDDYADSLQF